MTPTVSLVKSRAWATSEVLPAIAVMLAAICATSLAVVPPAPDVVHPGTRSLVVVRTWPFVPAANLAGVPSLSLE